MYEQAIRVPYYGIYEVEKAAVEMYHLIENSYRPLAANDRGRYPIHQLKVELGIWQGSYFNLELPWLRWWDAQGNLLLTGEERADAKAKRADAEAKRAERLAAQLKALGIEPEA